jgi:hypothetical protein
VPRSDAAAIREEVEADLEAAIRVTLVNLVIALDPNLGLRLSAAEIDDGPVPPAGPLVTFQHSERAIANPALFAILVY